MKGIKLLISVIVTGMVSCGTAELKNPDLAGKGLIKARVISREGSGTTKWVSHVLYFRKLDDANDLTKGKIISSEVHMDEKIVLNFEPGTYVIIASLRRSYEMSSYLICYNEELANKTKIDLKAGDIVDLGDIYVEENSANFFGNISEFQNKTRDTIGSEFAAMQLLYKLGTLDKGMYPKEKKEVKQEEKREVIEKFE